MISKILHILVILASAKLMALPPEYRLRDVDNPPAISFKDALALAVKNNVNLKQASYEVMVSESNAQTALSPLLPSISINASYQAHKDSEKSFQDNTKSGLNLKLALLDASQLIEFLAKQKASLSASQKFLHEQDVLISEAGIAYIDALLAQSAKNIALEELELYKRRRLDVEKKKGLELLRYPDLGVAKAKISESRAHADYLKKSQDFDLKMGDLGLKIGRLDNFLLLDVVIESSLLSLNENELYRLALMANDMKSATTDVKAAELSLLSVKLDFLPKIQVSAESGYRFYSEKISTNRKTELGSSVMFTLDLPLISGGKTLAVLKSKTAEKTLSELTLRTKPDEKKLSINSLNQQLKDLTLMESNAKLSLASAISAQESAERLSKKEEITDLELKESIANLVSVKEQVAGASFGREKAKIKLLFVIGKIRDLL